MNVDRSTVGTKKSRQPKRQKSLNLVHAVTSVTHDSPPLYLLLTANDKWLQAGQRSGFKIYLNLKVIISLKKYMLMMYFGTYTILWILAFFMFYNKKYITIYKTSSMS